MNEGQEFKKLLKLIESRKVSTLIVKDMSRLGRDLARVLNLMEVTFPKYNVRLITVDDCVDNTKGTSFYLLCNSVGVYYRNNNILIHNK